MCLKGHKVIAGGLKPSSRGPQGSTGAFKLPPFSEILASPTTALEYFSKAGTPKKMNWEMARARVKAHLATGRSLVIVVVAILEYDVVLRAHCV